MFSSLRDGPGRWAPLGGFGRGVKTGVGAALGIQYPYTKVANATDRRAAPQGLTAARAFSRKAKADGRPPPGV